MPKQPKFDLEAVRNITVGPEAQGRKRHNRQRPGEAFVASTPEDASDKLVRANKKSAQAEQKRLNNAYKGKPRAGEVLTASDPEQEKADDKALKEFLHLAGERFRLAADAEGENRRDALDDLKFLSGEQWGYDIRNARELDGRPCLTMNHLPQFVRQVTNEQRQQRPSVQVNPVGDDSDTDTAEIFQGMIRHIEVISDAEIAYDTAFEQCVINGFGWWRIVKEYVDDGSDEQELKIKKIKNQFTVYNDPSSVEPCYEDARWRHIVEDIPRAEYKVRFPKSDEASLTEFVSVGDNFADWVSRETIRVSEYWYVEETAKTMARLNSGEMVEKTKDLVPEAIKNERQVIHRKVKCAIINAVEILEEYEWEGQFIPQIPVLGDDYDIDGKRFLAGLVRHAKDPQRMYNYWVSSATEMIALAPRAPYIGAEGQFEGHEAEWQKANVKNISFLQYKPQDVGGKPVPAPQRQQYEPPIQSINLMVHQADNDLKATIGIYDASLGQKGPDQSGKAILARKAQSEISTMNFSDNLARSIRHTGRVLIDLIPKIYDTPRVQRIISPDTAVTQVGIYNSQNLAGQDQQAIQDQLLAKGVKKVYDIGIGRYDISVSVGPSYQSKRQEAVVAQMEFLKAYPAAAPAIAPIIAGNSDWPGAKEIQKKLKKLQPPQLQDDEDGDDPEAKINKLQSQLQQAMQQHDLAMKSMQDMHQIIQSKQIETNSKLQIAQMDNQTRVAVAEITTKAQDAAMRRKFEFEEWKMVNGFAHDAGMEAMSHVNTLSQNQQGHDQALEQQDQAGQQQSALAAQQAESQAQNGAAQ